MSADGAIAFLLVLSCLSSSAASWHLFAAHRDWSGPQSALFVLVVSTAFLTGIVAIPLIGEHVRWIS